MKNEDRDEFFDGQEVRSIFWPEGGQITAGVGECGKITVVMECGQSERVPWFACWDDHKIISKFNGAFLQGVEI